MHAYILATGRRISPFNQPVGEMRIHNRRLREHQAETLQALGCTVEWIDRLEEVRRLPALLISDDLYFTYYALSGFLKAEGKSAASSLRDGSTRTNSRAALAVSMLTERFVPKFQGPQVDRPGGISYRAYDCYFLRQFEPHTPLEQQSELVPIRHKVGRVRSLANRHFEPSGRFVIPASAAFMMPIGHWSCLVAANILGMPGFFLRALQQRPAAALSLPGRMVWRAGSFRPARLLGKLYLADRRCRIDPSAHVEAAILGSHVKIGPNAVVRGCVVGNGATIGAGALVEGCTLGTDATVNPNVVVRCCVVGPEANMGSYFTQLSVLGSGAVLCPDSALLDFSFRSSVTVNLQLSPISCGSRVLGGCLGDRALLGPGLKLAPGQELPNDCVLVENPRGLVRGVGRPLPDQVLQLDGSTGRPISRRHNRAA